MLGGRRSPRVQARDRLPCRWLQRQPRACRDQGLRLHSLQPGAKVPPRPGARGSGATEGIDVSDHRPLARLDATVLKLWAEEGLAAGPQAGQWAGVRVGRAVSPSRLLAASGFPSLDRAGSSLEPCRHVRKAEAGHLEPLLDEGLLSPGRPRPGARI